MARHLYIGGVSPENDRWRDYVSNKGGVLAIEQELTSIRDSAKFSVKGEEPFQGEEVVIMDDSLSGRLFAGIIKKVELIESGQNKTNVWSVDCDDYTELLDKKLINEVYENIAGDALFQDLLLKYFPDFTGNGIQGSAPIVESYPFEYIHGSEAFNAIAEYTGRYWYPDYYKDIKYFSPEDLVTPAPLDIVPGAFFRNLRHKIDTQGLCNRVYVRGGKTLSDTYHHEIVADGKARAWVLPHKAHQLTVKVGAGEPVIPGIENIDDPATKAYLQNFQERRVVATPTTATPVDGITVDFAYKYDIDIITVVEDLESQAKLAAVQGGDGVYEHSIIDESITSVEAAEALGQKYINEHGNAKVRGSFETEVPGWSPGQLVNISLTDRGISGTYLIQKVTISPASADKWTYKVEYGGRLYGIADYLKALVSAQQKKQIGQTNSIYKFVYGTDRLAISDEVSFEERSTGWKVEYGQRVRQALILGEDIYDKEDSQSDFMTGTLTDVVATVAGDLELAYDYITFTEDFATGVAWAGTVDVSSGYLKLVTDGTAANTINDVVGASEKSILYKMLHYGRGSSGDEFYVHPIWVDNSNCLQTYFYTYGSSQGSNNYVQLQAVVANVTTTLYTCSKYNFYNDYASWFWVRLHKDGRVIKFKLWKDGTTEPESWDYEGLLPENTPDSGKFRIYGKDIASTGSGVDNITITYRTTRRMSGKRIKPAIDLSPLRCVRNNSISWVAQEWKGGRTDGATGYIDLPLGSGHNPVTSTFEIEMEVWVPDLTGNPFLISTPGGTNQRCYISIYNGKWNIGIQDKGQGDGAVPAIDATTGLNKLKLSLTGSAANLYVDKNDGNGWQLSFSKAYTAFTLAGNFQVGRDATGAANYVRLFINYLKFTGGLTAAYDFYEMSGMVIHDSVGTAHGITYGGFAWHETKVAVETSIDSGATWQQPENGGTIPGINLDDDLTGMTLLVRETLTSTSEEVTPLLRSLEIDIGNWRVGDVITLVGSMARVLTLNPTWPEAQWAKSSGGGAWTQWQQVNFMYPIDTQGAAYFRLRADRDYAMETRNYKKPTETDAKTGEVIVWGA